MDYLRPQPGIVLQASGKIVSIPEAVIFQQAIKSAYVPVDAEALVQNALVDNLGIGSEETHDQVRELVTMQHSAALKNHHAIDLIAGL